MEQIGKNCSIVSIYQAIFLGLVQGLTEFLPVSSSGHLVIVQNLMNFKQDPLAFDALLHLGTLAAVLVYFRAELALLAASILKWLFKRERDKYTALAGYLAAATVPAAVAGVVFEKLFSDAFQSVMVVGSMLFVTGAILWLADGRPRGAKTLENISLADSLKVGLAQAAAVMPGLSRSGATISAGIWLGFERREAARFSFLLSVPIILGAALFSLKDGISAVGAPAAAAAMAAAAGSGFLAIAGLMRIIQEQRLRLFSVYCFIMGSVAFALAVVR